MKTLQITNQVKDDKVLLQLMMQDFNTADPEYKWTNFWHRISEELYDFLLNTGLKDFRRTKQIPGTPGYTLRSFAAVDLFENAPSKNYEAMYNYVSAIGKKVGSKPLNEISISDFGNPEDLTYKDGSYFTYYWLRFYLRYSYVSQFFKFDEKIIVELGSGSGKQAEMIKKSHPSVTILMFDIVPQLYIQNQYLKAVFPNDVVDYYETRNIVSLKELQKGKIYIFSNTKFPLIQDIKADLFWNTASFQEMEPKIVENYLSIVRGVPYIYLMQQMKGMAVAPVPGVYGVLEQVTLQHYKKFLPNYKLFDIVPALPTCIEDSSVKLYSESLWKIAP